MSLVKLELGSTVKYNMNFPSLQLYITKRPSIVLYCIRIRTIQGIYGQI